MSRTWLRVLVMSALAPHGACLESAPPTPSPARYTPMSPAVGPRAAAPQRFVGVIAAADVVDLASRFDGVIAAIHVRAGDPVVAGQVVVEVDPRPMREQLSAAVAALTAAKAAIRQADVDVADARRRVAVETKAVHDGVSPQVMLDEAQFALQRAEAAAQRAAATAVAESSRIQIARDHLADTSLRARADGMVAMRFKDPGATVSAGAPIVRVVGQREPRLRFAVPPDAARSVTVGAQVSATVETIGDPMTAVVRRLSPTVDPASGLIIVEADLLLGAHDADLRPGLPATVSLAP